MFSVEALLACVRIKPAQTPSTDRHHRTQIHHLSRLQRSASHSHLHWGGSNCGKTWTWKALAERGGAQLQRHPVTLLVAFVPSAGLNLYGRQEDGREEQDATTIRKTGPGLHRPPAHGRDHLPGDLQGVPPDGTVYFKGRRYELVRGDDTLTLSWFFQSDFFLC